MEEFRMTSDAAAAIVQQKAAGHNIIGNPRPAVSAYVARRKSTKAPTRRSPF
jgi:PiT family inorganic phosphate transporter